jgi:hypothetical protein
MLQSALELGRDLRLRPVSFEAADLAHDRQVFGREPFGKEAPQRE